MALYVVLSARLTMGQTGRRRNAMRAGHTEDSLHATRDAILNGHFCICDMTDTKRLSPVRSRDRRFSLRRHVQKAVGSSDLGTFQNVEAVSLESRASKYF